MNVTEKIEFTARRCSDLDEFGTERDVVEIHLEATGNPFVTCSLCLPPTQAIKFATELLHEATKVRVGGANA